MLRHLSFHLALTVTPGPSDGVGPRAGASGTPQPLCGHHGEKVAHPGATERPQVRRPAVCPATRWRARAALSGGQESVPDSPGEYRIIRESNGFSGRVADSPGE